MELRQLQIFCSAAETLNFTKAGLKLGYAQSNITGQIRQLEEELQVKLFERLGRGIQLTSEGKKFLVNAKHILELCDKAKAEIAPQVFRGIINIGTAETICIYRLPQILIEYRKLYPLVEIRVQTEACDNLFTLLKSNDIDIALVLTDTITAPEMTVRTLQDEPLAVVVSPLHPLAEKKKITPGDFAGECLIVTLPGCGYRPLILAMLREHNVIPGSLMELSSIGAIKQCTMCGLGIAVIPEVAVRDELERGKLLKLDFSEASFDVKAQLIYHQEKWLTPAMQAFLELCKMMR
ncbi:LysR family transcriptional regulator [Anaerosporomusa subterranea]|uniref:LysR family transcriptional regulator n=1 Tax=Anaerosporomusa subterranea TaxID=1794912 RepID=A0A154BQW9_ANASB|nr:LysR family transcriptional regulator [Anaerosporomusa subterranea]KYZ75908.1 LysR family transcriptional regulator [Anaerosporomusa subterranea]